MNKARNQRKRYYLVRKNLERLIGPVDLKELMFLIKSMRVGPGDEICGSLSKWIKLESVTLLFKYYPEVFKKLQNDQIEWIHASGIDLQLLSGEPKKDKTLDYIIYTLLLLLVVVVSIYAHSMAV